MSFEKIQEPNYPKNGVYQKDGKWFMRFDDKTDGVEIPDDIAKVISVALRAQQKEQARRKGDLGGILEEINCHRTVFYILGLPYRTERSDISLFSVSAFKEYSSKEELQESIFNRIGSSIGILQIRKDDPFEYEVSHSLIVGFDERGRGVCFNKVGYRYPFEISSLDDVIQEYSYPGQGPYEWAFDSIENVENSQAFNTAKHMLESMS